MVDVLKNCLLMQWKKNNIYQMDKKEALKQIKAGDFFLGNADEKLKTDKKFILAVVKQDVSALDLDYVDDSLKNDPDILAIVNKGKWPLN